MLSKSEQRAARRAARGIVLSREGANARQAKPQVVGSPVLPATHGPCKGEMPSRATTDWLGNNMGAPWRIVRGHKGSRERMVPEFLRETRDRVDVDKRLVELMNDRELATREYAAILERRAEYDRA